MREASALVAVAVAFVGLVACGDGGAADGSPRTVTVFAAASLTDAFGELADAFERRSDGITVELNLAGSSSLREQLLAGAPGDVFAPADTTDMERLAQAGAVAAVRRFARNPLQIAVPAGNPGEVSQLSDLADDDLLVGLCVEQVPCGRLARRAFALAGATPSVDTEEPDVRALLTKIELGELDAGVVYRTDVLAAGDAVQGIALPAGHGVEAVYSIARLTDADDPRDAEAFVAFVLGPEGRRILARHGFEAP